MHATAEAAINDYYSRAPRRLELPVKVRGVDCVVIARENNDGEAICYVCCLSKEQIAEAKATKTIAYSSIELSSGDTDNIFGMLDVEDEKLRVHVLDMAWAAAQLDAKKQVEFLEAL